MISKNTIIAGMDEAGRGPWAGPVVAAAVILPRGIHLPGLNDSKKVTEKKREELYAKIKLKAEWGIGKASHKEIDRHGLLKATQLAFQRALDSLPRVPEHLLIDGRDNFTFSVPHTSIIRGDQKIRSIKAASILAKVARDKLMKDCSLKFPEYSFDKHKGYGTQKHQLALQKYGVTPVHRRSFKPVQAHL
ncbi:ribonuclease HII [Candidatus Peregrinibacteria bacterium]|jgi:ribonuclease HII|nr:ribonuclease HII [Candidatus Peregrinibacteria bacterium]MBT7483140.1 ribonuclease HII [Candidatus Peregrinibacteria bacterium]MBT7703840.1 ribonuclease HII [Candidatus Peregrinibacteria bacterium]